jgi:hypothetical protein
MPQDPNLYGQPAPKKQKRQMALSSSLDFASQLSSLISQPTTSSATNSSAGRPRPSKSKDAFANVKIKRKDAPPRDDEPRHPRRLRLKSPTALAEGEQEELARSRRKLEEKARLYAAMKRGDHTAREGEAAPLVDFDRKWAERRAAGHDSSEDEDSGGDEDETGKDEVVEYTDEFGRTRTGTATDRAKEERRAARGVASAAELAELRARPSAAPQGLIVGDAVQTAAFQASDEAAMSALAARRDRSATPPESTHYDGRREVRNRGTGFFAFSADGAERAAQMAGLEEERVRTETARREREDKMAARRAEVEARRREVGERRAKKMADGFLEGFGKEIFGEGKDGEKGDGK